MISDDVVEQVAQAADIVAIIGEHVRLKKTGSVYRGPCPFHQGTSNNFSVVPKGGYTCFVCGEKGSVFTFLQKRLGLSFVEERRSGAWRRLLSAPVKRSTLLLAKLVPFFLVGLVQMAFDGVHNDPAARMCPSIDSSGSLRIRVPRS